MSVMMIPSAYLKEIPQQVVVVQGSYDEMVDKGFFQALHDNVMWWIELSWSET